MILTLANFQLVKGMRFRMTKDQMARGLTREQAFSETYGPRDISAPVLVKAEPAHIPKVAGPSENELVSRAHAIVAEHVGTPPYSRIKRELGISWCQTVRLVDICLTNPA